MVTNLKECILSYVCVCVSNMDLGDSVYINMPCINSWYILSYVPTHGRKRSLDVICVGLGRIQCARLFYASDVQT